MADKSGGSNWAKEPGPAWETLNDKYQKTRSWLVDTAETAEQKKALKANLAKLAKEYAALKKSQSNPKKSK